MLQRCGPGCRPTCLVDLLRGAVGRTSNMPQVLRALAKPTRDEQKAVKTSVFDLQTNSTGRGLQLHRIDASQDPHFWSCRVNRDIRIIVHKTASGFLIADVDHS